MPYRRLVKEWSIYAVIMAGVFLLLLRDSTSTVGLLIGLGVSLPLYVGLSYVMAKFGYQRKSLAELRTPRAASTSSPAASSEQAGSGQPRARPAPTRRTSAGPNRQRKRR